ncbi:hypothetical protein ScPMuIL_006976 [Solemya velum]
MMSFVCLLWCVLSSVVCVVCTASLVLPFWIIHPDNLHTFGLYKRCVARVDISVSHQDCGVYGGVFQFGQIPSGAWQAACMLYGGGCVFLALGFLVALASCCCSGKCSHKLTLLAGYFQTIAFLIMMASLVIYPFGFNTHYFRYYCGMEADMYFPGHCGIGWGYMLAVMGTALAIFCPVLSYFRDSKVEYQFPIDFL